MTGLQWACGRGRGRSGPGPVLRRKLGGGGEAEKQKKPQPGLEGARFPGSILLLNHFVKVID